MGQSRSSGAAPGELHFRRCSIDGGRANACGYAVPHDLGFEAAAWMIAGANGGVAVLRISRRVWMLRSLLGVTFRFEEKFEIEGRSPFELLLFFCRW